MACHLTFVVLELASITSSIRCGLGNNRDVGINSVLHNTDGAGSVIWRRGTSRGICADARCPDNSLLEILSR